MGWIWLLFVAFSVLGNLLEKLATEQKSSRPVKPGKEGGQPIPQGKPFSFPFPPFLMGELEAESRPTESMPGHKPDLMPAPDGKIALEKPTNHPREQGEFSENEDWERLFDQKDGFDEEDYGAAYPDAVESDLENLYGQMIDAPLLYDALVLAHVLPRPDFRTVPWRRRP